MILFPSSNGWHFINKIVNALCKIHQDINNLTTFMAWNDNNNNPWGNKNKETPPELDEIIKDFKNKFGGIFGGGKPPGGSEKVVQIPSPKEALNI